MTSVATSVGRVVIATAIPFSGAAMSGSFLSTASTETRLSHYQETKNIVWNDGAHNLSEQIGPAFSNTFTGKPSFVVAYAPPASAYGQAELLDEDDYLYD